MKGRRTVIVGGVDHSATSDNSGPKGGSGGSHMRRVVVFTSERTDSLRDLNKRLRGERLNRGGETSLGANQDTSAKSGLKR